MPGRIIAIGDIHGCLAALRTILRLIEPRPDDTIITLGDYVDRGPDSRGVIQTLIDLEGLCHYVPLLGNHDQIFLQICLGGLPVDASWIGFGGDATIASYGKVPEGVPPEHIAFLKGCRLSYEATEHFFVHGCYDPDIPLDQQSPAVLLWNSLKLNRPSMHFSGKRAVVGHTSQKDGEILDLGHVVCIDTRCWGKGWLTALDVTSGRVWQADKYGVPRPGTAR